MNQLTPSLSKQHLIDPEICIRCNTCEETCPEHAIVHNDDNYVVRADICGHCMKCVDPCPTGAINNWFSVGVPFSVEQQFSWTELPPRAADEEDTELRGRSRPVPPPSASKPSVNLHNRSHPVHARVLENLRLTPEDSQSDIRHVVLQFPPDALPFLEGQNVGVVPPGHDGNGKPHEVRQYSIASARRGEQDQQGTLALTIKRVADGVCSNYLCNLQAGDEVHLTGPFGATFLLPQDPDSHLIMICTGTGIAPFRGFLEQRLKTGAPQRGRLMLFYGARTPDEMPYLGRPSFLSSDGVDQQLCFSRAPNQPKTYVQDQLLAQAATLSALLQDDASHIFVCGLKGMENGVSQALGQICSDTGLDWDSIRQRMVAAGRLHMETY